MMKLICFFAFSMAVVTAAMAGKNANGSLVVHTDDAHGFTSNVCAYFDSWVPDDCEALNTRTDNEDIPPTSLIWFIAAFSDGSSPAVVVVYFGHDHNLPPGCHGVWGLCGPYGSIEIPDAGWPDDPANSGNSVAFGLPIEGDLLFPVYYFSVWGFEGAYYCSAINPVGGYGAYVDDNNPPLLDEILLFGCVRWYESGYNECPSGGTPVETTTWGVVKATYR